MWLESRELLFTRAAELRINDRLNPTHQRAQASASRNYPKALPTNPPGCTGLSS